MNLLCTEQVVLKDSDTLLSTINDDDDDAQNTDHMGHHQSQQEHQQRINYACSDPTFLTDRCLENLLKAEEKFSDSYNNVSYFKSQKDITPEMRKIVAEWMMQVNKKY